MVNLARPMPNNCPGDAMVRGIVADGSGPIVLPLQQYLERSGSRPDLRSTAKAARVALLADIAHFMHISHGRHPGIIDYAAHKIGDIAARDWLIQAIDGMAAERVFLNKLTVTAGPIRRLNGQDKVNAILENQAKSFQMLSTSDRKGCPAGAAIAFIVDWHQTRNLLIMVADESGVQTTPLLSPSVGACAELVRQLDDGAAYRRAMAFGAQQILAQQRGLWQLIVARHLEIVAT